ncbi:hypothetical protein J6590_051637 [Homalodisca vitripennis]|nr:hypothetical protein J6590_051637 [Homalodisca vitripennis]
MSESKSFGISHNGAFDENDVEAVFAGANASMPGHSIDHGQSWISLGPPVSSGGSDGICEIRPRAWPLQSPGGCVTSCRWMGSQECLVDNSVQADVHTKCYESVLKSTITHVL